MNRNGLIAIIVGLLVTLGYGAAVFAYGGNLALEMASPGQLYRDHVRLNNKVDNCKACHKAWKTIGSEGCRECHNSKEFSKKPASAIKSFHLNLTKSDCLICHTEHKGQNGSITRKGSQIHQLLTEKELTNCSACHQKEKARHLTKNKNLYDGKCNECHMTVKWIPTIFSHQTLTQPIYNNCNSCHQKEYQVHLKNKNFHFGENCLECHTVSKWKPTGGDLGALVTGAVVNCTSCHINQINKKHIEDYGKDCVQCHSIMAWKSLKFQHKTTNMTCSQCHTQPVGPIHQGLTGKCNTCHSTSSWVMKTFNHNNLSPYKKSLCTSCHQQEAQAHQGRFGGDCTQCHSTKTWAKSSFQHGIKVSQNCSACHKLPSSGYHKDVLPNCENCHTSERWQTSQFDHQLIKSKQRAENCFSCHRQDFNRHWPQYLKINDCKQCHIVNSWKQTTFNHDTSLKKCAECHYPPDVPYHRNLGDNCAACHNTKKWLPALFDHSPWGKIPEGHTTRCSSCHM